MYNNIMNVITVNMFFNLNHDYYLRVSYQKRQLLIQVKDYRQAIYQTKEADNYLVSKKRYLKEEILESHYYLSNILETA